MFTSSAFCGALLFVNLFPPFGTDRGNGFENCFHLFIFLPSMSHNKPINVSTSARNLDIQIAL